MKKGIIAGTSLIILTGMLQGCNGGGADEQLPPLATVEITPTKIEWEISPARDLEGRCLLDENVYNDNTVQFNVLSAEGVPLGGVEVQVLADLSGQTYPGFSWIKLYDDRNGNGVADDDEYVSDGKSSAFRVKTDQYTGIARVIVRTNLSCPYTASLYVYASSATGIMSIDVQAREELESN